MKAEIKAVVIDYDDTLCLTESACFDLENTALVQMGRPKMSRKIHIQTWGQPMFEAILDRSPGIDVEEFKKAYHPLIEEFTEQGRLDTIPPANLKVIDELMLSGTMVMVLTSRTEQEVARMLKVDRGLLGRVKAFYHKGNTAFHKPDPRVFDELLRDHQLKPEECVYVGDSLGDATAAKAAGLYFIASLESGLRQREEFESLGTDGYIDRFTDLQPAVEML